MGSNDQINKLFWLAYCDTLKKKVGELGPEFAIFYASEAQPVSSLQFHQWAAVLVELVWHIKLTQQLGSTRWH
jgi:hypothetical protein